MRGQFGGQRTFQDCLGQLLQKAVFARYLTFPQFSVDSRIHRAISFI
jgi:hypothetical protein